MKKQHPLFPPMKSFASAVGLVAGLTLLSHSAIAQPTISGTFPNGSYQFQDTNILAFTAASSVGVANVSVTLTPTTVFGVQGFPQTLTSSGGLTISGSANSESVSAPINSNTLYSAQIIVTDSNNASVTNSFSFDTITPIYTWEARDWDYTSNGISGLFIDNPQTNAYLGLASTAGVDFNSVNSGSGTASYRPQGLETEGAGDVPRLPFSPFTTNGDYDIGFNNGGNWANYTRHYPPGQYNVFVRAADGNGAQANAGDIALEGGTASFEAAGPYYFSVKSTGWQTYGWYPLINSTNGPAILDVPADGTASTLRMTIDGGNCNENFFMLLAVNTNTPPVGEGSLTNEFPNGVYQFQATNTFNGTVISPNGIGNIVADVQGTYLAGGSFSQTLTPTSGLTITGNSTNKNVAFPLSTDALYSITFLITDGAGNGSTASVSFDTINPNYFTWEAEDWDYNGGSFIDNPQIDGYVGLSGEANVDAYNPGGCTHGAYRGSTGSPIDYGDLNTEGPNGDVERLQFTATNSITDEPYVDYDVGFTGGGQWANYTRTYPGGAYNIYVRAASGGNGATDAGSISLITSGFGTSTQTLSQLGTYNVPPTGNWQKYTWCQVLNSGGYPARFFGTNGVPQTLRMTFVNADCNLNCYMLVPANLANNPPPFVNGFSPDGSALFQPSTTVNFTANSSVGFSSESGVTLYLNGQKQSGLTFGGNQFAYSVSCPIQTNQFYTAIVTLTDSVGTTSYTNSFATLSAADYQWQADEYDYSNGTTSGLFFDNPQTNAYAGLGGAAGIDELESDPNGFSRGYVYRAANGADFPDMNSGDLSRPQYPSTADYAAGSFGPGSWANYTRHYPPGTYNIIGRFAEGAAVTHARMSILTGGYQTSSQTTSPLGTFTIPDGGWSSYGWVILEDASGKPAKVTLDGNLHTLQMEGSTNNNEPEANAHFLILAATSPEPSVSASVSAGGIHISFFTQTGWTYQVEYKNNLTDPSWTPLGSSLSGNNAVQTVSDTLSASHRYYLVQIQP